MKKLIFKITALMILLAATGCNANENAELSDVKSLFEGKYENELLETDSWLLPDFTGWSCLEVAHALNDVGQKYSIIFKDDEDMGLNVVMEQSPNCGERVKKDETIKLFVNGYHAKRGPTELLYNHVCPIAEYDQWVYFTDFSNIYKSGDNFATAKKIFSLNDIDANDEKILAVIPKADTIYFIVGEFFCGSLCSIMNDGTKFKRIIENEKIVDYFTTGDSIQLYNLMDNRLTSFNVSTGEITKTNYDYISLLLIQHADHLYYFYFAENSTILMDQKLNDTAKTRLIEFEKQKVVTNMCLYNNSIYYTYYNYKDESNSVADRWLCKYDLQSGKGSDIKKLRSNKFLVGSYIIFTWRDWLYIANEYELYKFDSRDKMIKRVFNWKFTGYYSHYGQVCGNYLYLYEPFGDNRLCNLRYNLLTDKYERFNWDAIFNKNTYII